MSQQSRPQSQLEEVQPHLLVEGWIPPPLGRDFTVVGTPQNRIDGVQKVTGTAKYAGDIKLPGMLYAKILRSPYAHARIRRIDTSKAEKLPGVKAIISSATCSNWYTFWYGVKQPAFPLTVCYVGHEVAVVAAVDVETARKAIDLIEVDYDILPAVFDAEEAMKPGAPQVTLTDELNLSDPESYGPAVVYSGNIFYGKPGIKARGDVAKGFREADVIVEGTYKTPFQHHGTIQTRTCVASWDENGLTVQDSIQGVWLSKKDLATSLELPPEKVNVKVKYQGGGFGSKASVQRYTHYAAKLSMLTGKPVRIELTRGEEFVSHPRRPSVKVYFKTGVKSDGTLMAIYAKAITNIGCGGGAGKGSLNLLSLPFSLHRCPNMYFEQWGVHTNLQYTGPMRSPNNIESCSCFEAHIDEVAEAVGMDPLAFRLKNYTPYADQTTRMFYSSKQLDKAMRLVTEKIGWNNGKRHNGGSKKYGRGMASYVVGGVGNNPAKAKAEVIIRNDGTVELHAGVVDIGTGSATTLTMIAAEELGISVRDIATFYGDTETSPWSPSSNASRVMPEMGPPVLQAAAGAREKLFEAVAKFMMTEASDLKSASGWIHSVSDPRRIISFKEACGLIGEQEISGKGSRAPNPSNNFGSVMSEPDKIGLATFGAAAVEVEVNTETGAVKVVRAALAHEFGKVLNPKLVDSQFYGGTGFGMGFGILEEPILDKKTGIMLNTDLHQYRLATSVDYPEEITPIKIEGEDPFFAYSAKGGGDYTNTGVPAAIRNAVHDATGVWLYEYPLTRDRVLAGLAKMKVEREKERALRIDA